VDDGAVTDELPYRCSVASEERDESVSASASTVRGFVLVEHPGPWGVDAFRDARLPDGVGLAFKKRVSAAKAKPLMIRRTAGGSRKTEGIRVFAAYADPVSPWVETTVLASYDELAELPVENLAAGQSLGIEPHDGLVMGVCTHGRHDACCAERGRPVAMALAEAFPEEAWELSHLGGDRWAANMLVLPHGLFYGRLDEESVRHVARLLRAGELELDHLRGRSGFASQVQAAEAAVRRWTDERRLGAVRFVSREAEDAVSRVVLEVDGRPYAATVVSTRSEERFQLTCRATRLNPAMTHAVTEIAAL
jgi:hypothetical protein